MSRRGSMLRLSPEEYDRWQAKCPVCGFERLFCMCPRAAEASTAKPSLRKPPPASEAEVQVAVLAFLRHHPLVAWVHRANTGSGYLINARLYRELVARGVLNAKDCRFMRFGFPGLSDNIGQLRDGRFLAVETKAAGKHPTDDQQAFLDAVNGAGGVGFVARSVDDVAAALQS